RVAGTNVDIQASLAPLQGIYDPTACDCQNGAVVRYYTQKVGRGGAAPSSRDISSGWQATGVSAGLGATSSAITVNCAGDDDVFVAAEIEFTTVAPGAAGFTTLGKVTSNSTRVECGPNVVDQPVQIERPRQNRPLAPRGKGRR
ncbi:MAG: hypothetical protein GY716_14585, partial [bacterium]|nr:hypothetical protein [bacterium]